MLTIDSMEPIRALLLKRKLRIDPDFREECRRLFDNPGTRINYCRKDGLTIDGFAEAIWDAGYSHRPLTCPEALDILESILVAGAFAPQKSKRVRVSRSKTDEEATRARKNRMRKFACPGCGQIARGTRSTVLICGVCYAMTREIVPLKREDLLPEEILEAAAAAESESAA